MANPVVYQLYIKLEFMKYFGVIKKEEITDFSTEEIRYYLLEKEIYDNFFTEETFEKLFKEEYYKDGILTLTLIRKKI